jgi:hypothetical protein
MTGRVQVAVRSGDQADVISVGHGPTGAETQPVTAGQVMLPRLVQQSVSLPG